MHAAPRLFRRRHVSIGSVLLNGTDEAIHVDGLAPHLSAGAVSWSIWAKTGGSANLQMIVSINSAAYGNVLLMRIEPLASIVSFFGVGSAITGTQHASTSVIDNAWHHHVVTWDRGGDGKIRHYLDSVLQFTSTSAHTTSLASTDLWTIGAEYDPGPSLGDWFDGRVAQAAFYNRTLAAAEVVAAYNGGKCADERGLGCCALYTPGSAGNNAPTVLDIGGALNVNGTAEGWTASAYRTGHP